MKRKGLTIIEILPIVAALAFMGLFILFFLSMQECGGISKCVGKEVKKFKEGMNEEPSSVHGK